MYSFRIVCGPTEAESLWFESSCLSTLVGAYRWTSLSRRVGPHVELSEEVWPSVADRDTDRRTKRPHSFVGLYRLDTQHSTSCYWLTNEATFWPSLSASLRLVPFFGRWSRYRCLRHRSLCHAIRVPSEASYRSFVRSLRPSLPSLECCSVACPSRSTLIMALQ